MWTFASRTPGQRDCWRGWLLTRGALFSQPAGKAQGGNNPPVSPLPEDLTQHPGQPAQGCLLLCSKCWPKQGMKEGSAVLVGSSAGAGGAPQGLQGLLQAIGPMCERELFSPNCRPTAKIAVFVQMFRARKPQDLSGAGH